MKPTPATTKEARSFCAHNIKDVQSAVWSDMVSCEFTEGHVINYMNIHSSKLSERLLYLNN